MEDKETENRITNTQRKQKLRTSFSMKYATGRMEADRDIGTMIEGVDIVMKGRRHYRWRVGIYIA